MKRKYIYRCFLALLTGGLIAGLSSCNNDDFLNVEHYDILPSDQMFTSEESAAEGLVGLYDCLFPNDFEGDWNYKPQLLTGGHPTLDTQAIGWDADWCRQQWTADNSDMTRGWRYAYLSIGRANDFLQGLETSGKESAWKTYASMEGQAHALRGYFYLWLAENFGRVPMLYTGETYSNTPNKAAAETDDEMWDFIIEDFKTAVGKLDWKPQNEEYGRVTKGMALSYLAEAYLWKAYKARQNGDGDAKNTECITLAKDALKQVIESGTYELAPSYTTLWDPGVAWPKEAVWQVVVDMGSGNYAKWDSQAHIYNNFYAASPQCGGWGTEFLSWELYFAFEKGDKRRDASLCTNWVTDMPDELKSSYCFGYNPYLQQYTGEMTGKKPKKNSTWNHYYVVQSGDYAPGVWSLKMWRTQRCNWNKTVHGPAHFYQKRYAGVLLDYAECLFRLNGNDDSQAWAIIDQIRNRAFGNLEVGKSAELTATFNPYYQNLASADASTYGDYMGKSTYPIPFSEETVTVPDAKTYYTKFASESNDYHKSFTAYTDSDHPNGLAPWEVALGEERRKEFNSEFFLKGDLQRSEYIIPSIECNYPKGVGTPNTEAGRQSDWHYYRDWDFNKKKLIMPIPTDELLRNNLIKQNDGY